MAIDPPDDFYALLGIEVDASAAELRRAWRRLALRWHPDRAGAGATATFQMISAAYSALSDPVARAAYDRRRGVTRRPSRARPSGPAARTRRAPGVMLSRLTGSLEALLTCGVARRAAADTIELFLDEQEAAHGGMATISMRVKIRCPDCDGAGSGSCDRCRGRGTVDELYSAWLAVRPGIADGTVVAPTGVLRGMVRPVSFRIRIRERGAT